MTLKDFFKSFDLFADAPNAVEKMRELVMDLAVQGKLVAQDPHEVSAELERVRQDDLAIRSPFEIPRLWKWVELCDLAEINGGFAFKSTAYSEKGTRVVRISDFDETGFKDHKIVRHPLTPELQKFLLEEKNILMAMTGGTVGKSYLVRSLPEPMVVNQRVATIKVSLHANPSYIHIVLKSQSTQEVIRKAKNSTNDNISMTDIKSFMVPLPPLAEQKRIVAKVDELMALCDQLEAQQQERETRHAAIARASLSRFADAPTPTNLNLLFHKSYNIDPADLRKSILTLAVQDELVASDGVTEKVRLGDIVRFLGGYAFKSEWFRGNSDGIRLVRNQNISHGELDWSETEYLPAKRAKEFSNFELYPGDLVLSLNRPFISTGLKLAWIRESDCPCLLVQRVVCLRPDPNRLLPKYLFLWCNAPHFYRDAHVVPSSGVPYIAPPRVQKMAISLPPIDRQRRIVAKVDELMALVDALETQLTASRTKAAQLMEAVVAELTNPKSAP